MAAKFPPRLAAWLDELAGGRLQEAARREREEQVCAVVFAQGGILEFAPASFQRLVPELRAFIRRVGRRRRRAQRAVTRKRPAAAIAASSFASTHS